MEHRLEHRPLSSAIHTSMLMRHSHLAAFPPQVEITPSDPIGSLDNPTTSDCRNPVGSDCRKPTVSYTFRRFPTVGSDNFRHSEPITSDPREPVGSCRIRPFPTVGSCRIHYWSLYTKSEKFDLNISTSNFNQVR